MDENARKPQQHQWEPNQKHQIKTTERGNATIRQQQQQRNQKSGTTMTRQEERDQNKQKKNRI